MRNFTLIFCILCLTPICAFAEDTSDLALKRKIDSITRAEGPQIIDGNILFSYQDEEFVRLVGAAFSHEAFSRIHPFSRNRFGIFVLAIPAPQELNEIKYRLIIDGLWISDPLNEITAKDRSGIKLSVLSIPEIKTVQMKNPQIEKNNVDFTYKGNSGKSVYLAGNFNNWNPYIYQMKENGPGNYALSLELPPGDYYYCFFENGERKLDSLNSDIVISKDMLEANYFILK